MFSNELFSNIAFARPCDKGILDYLGILHSLSSGSDRMICPLVAEISVDL
jgi:hypothetical protein